MRLFLCSAQPYIASTFLLAIVVYMLHVQPHHRAAPVWLNAAMALSALNMGSCELTIDLTGYPIAIPAALAFFALSAVMGRMAFRQLFGPSAASSRAVKPSSDFASRS